MILIFDGDCVFCERVALWVQRHFSDAHRVKPWQSFNVNELESVYGLTLDHVQAAVCWVGETNVQAICGHKAIGHALISCDMMWGKVAGRLLLRQPFSWIAGKCYLLIARYRYHICSSHCKRH